MEDAKREPYKKGLHPKHKDAKAQASSLPPFRPPKKNFPIVQQWWARSLEERNNDGVFDAPPINFSLVIISCVPIVFLCRKVVSNTKKKTFQVLCDK